MTEREVEQAYREMMTSEAPDLWGRIESQLEVKEAGSMKQTFFGRIRTALFGGSIFRTAAAVCAICIICLGVIYQAGNGFYMGTSGGASQEAKSETYAAAGGSSGSMFSQNSRADGAAAEAAPEAAEYDMAEGGNVNEAAGTVTDAAADQKANRSNEEADQTEQTERKLIRDIYLDVETMDFDNFVDKLQKKTTELGGYVEASNISGTSYYYENSRYADLTLRIPKDKTDEFLNQVGEAANITSKSENVRDVTLTYVDLESHVKALRTEEEQLMNVLAKAENVEDIMSIQSRLSEVRYQLESYASQLKTYDNQVDYDTVTVYVSEVTKETPQEEPGIWEQMKDGFAGSILAIGSGFKELCIWFVANIPYFIILFVVVLAITAAVRTGYKRAAKRKNEKN